MKKLSEIYKELGIAFTFPIEIEDTNGNETYYENSGDYWRKYEYDANGRRTYFEDSDGFWSRSERDANGDETYYENRYGSKQGTPKSVEDLVTLDVDGAIRFYEMLKAEPSLPTPRLSRAAQSRRDSIVAHNQ